jgi:hypothetical protein
MASHGLLTNSDDQGYVVLPVHIVMADPELRPDDNEHFISVPGKAGNALVASLRATKTSR